MQAADRREARAIDTVPVRYHISAMIDWTNCPDVEQVPGRCSGQPVVKGTRVLVQGILDNAEDCTPEEIATDIFEGVTVEQVRRVLRFARRPKRRACCSRRKPSSIKSGSTRANAASFRRTFRAASWPVSATIS